MQIPAKIQHGEKVIATVFDKINGIIDYLNASRLRNSPDIFVDETPSGTLVKLNPRAKVPIIQQIIQQGGGTIGFPDLTGTTTTINDSNSYDITANSWLIGRVQSTAWSGADMSFYLNVVKTGSTSTPRQIRLLLIGNLDFAENFICIPIHSGLTISFTKDYIGMTSELQLYPCI